MACASVLARTFPLFGSISSKNRTGTERRMWDILIVHWFPTAIPAFTYSFFIAFKIESSIALMYLKVFWKHFRFGSWVALYYQGKKFKLKSVEFHSSKSRSFRKNTWLTMKYWCYFKIKLHLPFKVQRNTDFRHEENFNFLFGYKLSVFRCWVITTRVVLLDQNKGAIMRLSLQSFKYLSRVALIC